MYSAVVSLEYQPDAVIAFSFNNIILTKPIHHTCIYSKYGQLVGGVPLPYKGIGSSLIYMANNPQVTTMPMDSSSGQFYTY